MNKKYLLILGIILGIAGIIFLFRQENTNDTNTTKTQVEPTLTETKYSRYTTYSDAAFTATADKKRVLFFHASWCPTCRPADAEFRQRFSEIPEDVVLFKTDYDTSTELKNKYNVTYQHTYVQVDAEGNQVTQWNGGALSELLANIQ